MAATSPRRRPAADRCDPPANGSCTFCGRHPTATTADVLPPAGYERTEGYRAGRYIVCDGCRGGRPGPIRLRAVRGVYASGDGAYLPGVLFDHRPEPATA